MKRRAQTATEYLVILAVVIVIALIVVGVMGGIPGIGGGANKNALDAQMRTEPVGVDNYYVNATYARILLRNNQPDSVTVNKLTIDSIICSSENSEEIPVLLRTGEKKIVSCTGPYVDHSSGKTAPSIGIDYTITKTGANYFTSRYEEFDYSGFDEIVIDVNYNYMWQAGSTRSDPSWGEGGDRSIEDCSNRSTQTSYPACEYCESLALCYNGSFDEAGNCEGEYQGILHSDWRLPYYVSGSGEDYDVYLTAGTLRSFFYAEPFTSKSPELYFWTGTTVPSNLNISHAVNIFWGSSGRLQSGTKDIDSYYNVRCVRDHD